MTVTRSAELVVVEGVFPPGQGSSVHCRETVTVELVTPPLMVLTTVTVHAMPVVAPAGPGPTLLHWSTVISAARALLGASVRPANEKAAVSASTSSRAAR